MTYDESIRTGPAPRRGGRAPLPSGVEITEHADPVDREWDAFVASLPGASYSQTSMWGRIKAASGLRAMRVVLRRDGAPVAGCQLLLRRAPVIGAVGYIPLGPVALPGEPGLAAAAIEAAEQLARRERVAFLKLQPPVVGAADSLEPALAERGYTPSSLAVAPTCTAQIPLTGRSDEDLLAAMHVSTRRNVRRSEKGLTVEFADAAGLPILQEHVEATAARQGFTPYTADYHRLVFDTFAAEAEVRLLVVRESGTPLSSAMLIGFGDTVVYKIGGWSGIPSKMRPNELMQWHGMRWARDAGYAIYDLGGIDPAAARALTESPDARRDHKNGVAFFKLGLGGQVVEGPPTFDRAMPSLRGRTLGALAPHLQRRRATVARLAGRAR